MRDSFIMYESFYQATDILSNKDKLNFYDAIMQYAFYEQRINTSPTVKALIGMVIPLLDAQKKNSDNGKQGGRGNKKAPFTENEKPPLENKESNRNRNRNRNMNKNKNSLYDGERDFSSFKKEFIENYSESIRIKANGYIEGTIIIKNDLLFNSANKKILDKEESFKIWNELWEIDKLMY